MAMIFPSSDTDSLRPVMICCTTVTTLNIFLLSARSGLSRWDFLTSPPLLQSSVVAGTDDPAVVGRFVCPLRLPQRRRRVLLAAWRKPCPSAPYSGFLVLFFFVAPPLPACSHGNWRGEVSLLQSACSYSKQVFLFRGFFV
jgi:hypothetical protein